MENRACNIHTYKFTLQTQLSEKRFFQKGTSPRLSCVQTRSSQGISLSQRIIAKAEVHLHAESSVTRVFGFGIESPGRLHVTNSGGVFCFPVNTIHPTHRIDTAPTFIVQEQFICICAQDIGSRIMIISCTVSGTARFPKGTNSFHFGRFHPSYDSVRRMSPIQTV